MAMKPDTRLALGGGVMVFGLAYAFLALTAHDIDGEDLFAKFPIISAMVALPIWLGLFLILRALGWPRTPPPSD